MTITRPLLSAKFDDPKNISAQLALLKYPLFGSPKIDGIRGLKISDRGVVSRSFKLIPNWFIQRSLAPRIFDHLDGELGIGSPFAPDFFNKSTSAVMSRDGTPFFTYYVFDVFDQPTATYAMRLQFLQEQLRTLTHDLTPGFKVEIVPQKMLSTAAEVLAFEQECVEAGYEGAMLRRPDAPYKSGRSTLREQILIKIKRMEDDEATVVGFEPLERNQNVASLDAFGLQKRTSHAAGKVPDDLLGKLRVEHPRFGVFSIGSGFDVATRELIWRSREAYLGRIVTFKYQAVGTIGKPRIPIFKGFRED